MLQGHSDVPQTLKSFFKHPIEEIAHLPDWSWKKTLVVQALCGAASGLAAGLFPPSIWRILQGGLLFPILVTVMGALLACFFYYYFQIFERRTVSYIQLLRLIFFANLPYFLFHIPSAIFGPADVFGLGMAAMLLVVGLSENFQLEKRRSIRLMGIVFGLLFLLWLGEKFSALQRERISGAQSEESASR